MSASINATIHRYIYKTPKLLIFLICANSFSFRRMDGIRMFGVMMPFHAHNYFQSIRICAFSVGERASLFVDCWYVCDPVSGARLFARASARILIHYCYYCYYFSSVHLFVFLVHVRFSWMNSHDTQHTLP